MNRANYFAKQTKEDLQLIKLFREELTRINVLYLQAINSDDMSKADRLLKKLGSIAKTLENEFKLTDRSYNSESLEGKPFFELMKSDFKTASCIIIIAKIKKQPVSISIQMDKENAVYMYTMEY